MAEEGTPGGSAAPPPAEPTAAELRKAVRAERLAEVQAAIEGMSPAARAEAFLQLGARDRRQLLRTAAPPLAAAVLVDCDSSALADILANLRLRDLAPAFRLMAPDDLADLVRRMPQDRGQEVLAQLEGPAREEVARLLAFEPGTAGGMMTPRYVAVPDTVTAGKALERIRESAAGVSSSYVYLVDAGGRLVGVVPLRALVLASPKDPVRDYGLRDVDRLRSSAPAADVLAAFERRPLLSLPVVDEKDRLVGIVTAEEAAATRMQAEEQILRGLTGAGPREAVRATLSAAAGRAPWLGVTIAAGLGCALLASVFSDVLSRLTVVGAFVPLVLALADSVASQTMAVVLSARSGRRPAAPSLVWKELRVGLLVSAAGAVAVAAASVAWHRRLDLAVLIAGSVVASGAWAAVVGAIMPSLLEKARIRPENAGGPLTLAVADVSALALFLGSAAGYLAFQAR